MAHRPRHPHKQHLNVPALVQTTVAQNHNGSLFSLFPDMERKEHQRGEVTVEGGGWRLEGGGSLHQVHRHRVQVRKLPSLSHVQQEKLLLRRALTAGNAAGQEAATFCTLAEQRRRCARERQVTDCQVTCPHLPTRVASWRLKLSMTVLTELLQRASCTRKALHRLW